MFTITSTTLADVGVYFITSTATIPSNTTGMIAALFTSYSFTLTVLSDCVKTMITDKVINEMTNKVSFASVTQDISFLDSIATSHATPAYCGSIKYTLSPTNSFLTISGSIMSLTTSIVADVGEYTVYLTVSLTDYPGITSITKSIVVKITCEVQTIIFATAPTGTTIILVGIDI